MLPVLGRATPSSAIPTYLKSVTLLEPVGNIAAEVVSALSRMDGGALRLIKPVKLGLLGMLGAALGLAGWLFLVRG